METLVDRIKSLNDKGYKENFSVEDNHLKASGGVFVTRDNVIIEEEFRIEEDSDPTHQCIVYAIRCKEPEIKGVLVNTHGPQADSKISDFLNQGK